MSDILDSISELKPQTKKQIKSAQSIKNKLARLKANLEKLRLNPLHEPEEVKIIKKKIEVLKARLSK